MCDMLQEAQYLQREPYLLLQNQHFSPDVSNSDLKVLSWPLFQAHVPQKVPRVLSKWRKSPSAASGSQIAAGADALCCAQKVSTLGLIQPRAGSQGAEHSLGKGVGRLFRSFQ